MKSWTVTIEMKGTVCSFLLWFWFTVLQKVALRFSSLGETQSVTIQMKATEQLPLAVLFVMLYKGACWVCGSNL